MQTRKSTCLIIFDIIKNEMRVSERTVNMQEI
jgi:hypothetical protein